MERALIRILLLALVVGVVGSPTVRAQTQSSPEVFVAFDRYHADLLLPRAAVEARKGPLRAAAGELGQGAWIAVGYGDAAFYQGRGGGPARALDLARAVLWPRNPSVLHLYALEGPGALRAEDHVLAVTLTPERLAALLARVDRSFALEGGRPRRLSAPPEGGAFYAGSEPASAAHDCNAWAGEMLAAAGLPGGGAVVTSAALARRLTGAPGVRRIR